MDRTDILLAARDMLAVDTERLAALARVVPDLAVPLGGGSTWTARDAVVHLAVGADVYADIATGIPSPITSVARDDLAAFSAQRIWDVAETDPGKLAAFLESSMERFLSGTQGWAGEQEVSWHTGLALDLADLTGILAADVLVHGYDVSCAVGAPWPIDPGHALLTIGSYAPLLRLVVNPETTQGLTAAYGVTIRGGPTLTVRFTDGQFALEPPGADVDCEISVDPVAFLLVLTARLSRWPAVSLGLITAGGRRPDLAIGFPDLFVFP
jgi:uncharacterized protein (TIGR03083 family)